MGPFPPSDPDGTFLAVKPPAPSPNDAPLPLIRVGIPTFHRVDSLRRALESVLRQEGPFRLEVVVSDNASPDGTRAYLEGVVESDPRVTALFQPENRGPVENFRAVKEGVADGYYCWLGDDDWHAPGYLAACLAELEGDPELALVAGSVRFHLPCDDGATEVGAPCQLLHASPADRLREHFLTVRHNSVLFGLMRARHARELVVPEGVAADWMVVGQLAAVGKVLTIPGVEIHRSSGGVSSSMERVTAYFGLSGRRARNPWGVVSRRVGRFVARGEGLFGALPRFQRWRVGASCAWLLFRLHYWAYVRLKVTYAVLSAPPVQWIWRRLRPLVRRGGHR